MSVFNADTVKQTVKLIYTESQKVPTFKLSVTLSNLNRFSKFVHCYKPYEICYKTHTTLPTSPQAHCYTWEIKNSNFGLRFYRRSFREFKGGNFFETQCIYFSFMQTTNVTCSSTAVHVLSSLPHIVYRNRRNTLLSIV